MIKGLIGVLFRGIIPVNCYFLEKCTRQADAFSKNEHLTAWRAVVRGIRPRITIAIGPASHSWPAVTVWPAERIWRAECVGRTGRIGETIGMRRILTARITIMGVTWSGIAVVRIADAHWRIGGITGRTITVIAIFKIIDFQFAFFPKISFVRHLFFLPNSRSGVI